MTFKPSYLGSYSTSGAQTRCKIHVTTRCNSSATFRRLPKNPKSEISKRRRLPKIPKSEISKRRRLPEKGAERFSWGLACRSGASWLTEESTLALATQKSTRHALATHTHTRVDEPIEGGAAAAAPPLYGVIGSVCGKRVSCALLCGKLVCFPL